MSLADELEKLAGEATGGQWVSNEIGGGAFSTFDHMPVLMGKTHDVALACALRNALPAILSALREREAAAAWLRNGAYYGHFIGPATNAMHNRLADAIEAGEHMKGEGE
jgi:hypothetical protein